MKILFLKTMQIFEFFSNIYGENGRSWSWSRNFWHDRVGAAQKLPGSATLMKTSYNID
jgi:hypothetical protein